MAPAGLAAVVATGAGGLVGLTAAVGAVVAAAGGVVGLAAAGGADVGAAGAAGAHASSRIGSPTALIAIPRVRNCRRLSAERETSSDGMSYLSWSARPGAADSDGVGQHVGLELGLIVCVDEHALLPVSGRMVFSLGPGGRRAGNGGT